MSNSNPTLGLAINCQDEEHHIPISIAQFYNIVDDIVVVDGGSSDKSVEWAERMGARVFHRPWKHNYADQKNFACAQLNTDWIYVHDPDERIEPPLMDIIPLLISNGGQRTLMNYGILCESGEYFDCFGIPRLNYIDGIQTDHYPDYQYRLFKKHCTFDTNLEHRIHQEIVGFDKRTEVDVLRKTADNPSRFNILHYKTAKLQEDHDILFPKILRGELDGEEL
jgi:glycosyltransferase involved in cell wall biosynthesis